MAGTAHGLLVPNIHGVCVLIVEARYHAAINDMLVAGAEAVLERAGASFERLVVPGALEIPAAIKASIDADAYHGYVAVGCVIRGETTHYDLVAFESCRGLMTLGTDHGAAIGNGILTVENEAQAIIRADPAQQDKGGHAALAAAMLIDWRRQLRTHK